MPETVFDFMKRSVTQSRKTPGGQKSISFLNYKQFPIMFFKLNKKLINAFFSKIKSKYNFFY